MYSYVEISYKQLKQWIQNPLACIYQFSALDPLSDACCHFSMFDIVRASPSPLALARAFRARCLAAALRAEIRTWDRSDSRPSLSARAEIEILDCNGTPRGPLMANPQISPSEVLPPTPRSAGWIRGEIVENARICSPGIPRPAASRGFEAGRAGSHR